MIVIRVPLSCLIEVAKRSAKSFEIAHSKKTLWIFLTIIFPLRGAVVFLTAIFLTLPPTLP